MSGKRDTPRGPSATELHTRSIRTAISRASALQACAECGHLHFDPSTRGYVACPLEGCNCPMSPRVYGWSA